MMLIWYVLAGVTSGIVAGMGMGGGTLLIPILTIFLGVEQRLAQGINLIAFVPMALVALIIHCKNKLIDFKIGIPIMISGLIATIGGSLLATVISNRLLQRFFGGFLLIVGLWQIITIFLPKNSNRQNQYKFVMIFKIK